MRQAHEFAESIYRLTEENRHDLMPAGLTDVVIASKEMATSMTRLGDRLNAEASVRSISIGEEAPESARLNQARHLRAARLDAIRIVQRFLRTYENSRADRAAVTVPGYAEDVRAFKLASG